MGLFDFKTSSQYSVKYIRHNHRGSVYFVPNYAQHRPAAQCILNNEYYEPETHDTIKKIFAEEKGSMIHAGTFFGDMLPSFSASVSGTIFAFEPVLENYILARKCVEENNLVNVVLYNSALSDSNCNVRINTGIGEDRHRGGASSVDSIGVICPTLKIDDFEYSNLVLIQLDVEGHELTALRGGGKTIDLHRPYIMIEDNSKNCDNFLHSKGYEFIKSIPGLNIWVPAEKSVKQDYF